MESEVGTSQGSGFLGWSQAQGLKRTVFVCLSFVVCFCFFTGVGCGDKQGTREWKIVSESGRHLRTKIV